MRILSGELKTKLNQTVTVAGWVNSRRDHGGLIFIDLRDHQGIIQLVITPENNQAFTLAESLRDEYVISATGLIRKRAADLKNPNIETGDIELVVESIPISETTWTSTTLSRSPRQFSLTPALKVRVTSSCHPAWNQVSSMHFLRLLSSLSSSSWLVVCHVIIRLLHASVMRIHVPTVFMVTFIN